MNLVELSVKIEQEMGGWDSIPTITRVYETTDRGAFICPFPDCGQTRRDPAAMWRHVHFTERHGCPFGQPWKQFLRGHGVDIEGET